MEGYWVVEHYDGDELIGCWTTEHPGITGPRDLESMLAELIWQGRNVRWLNRHAGSAVA